MLFRSETLPGLRRTQLWSLDKGLCLRACLPQPPVSMVTRALWLDLGPAPIPPQPTPPLPLGREWAFVLGERWEDITAGPGWVSQAVTSTQAWL